MNKPKSATQWGFSFFKSAAVETLYSYLYKEHHQDWILAEYTLNPIVSELSSLQTLTLYVGNEVY